MLSRIYAESSSGRGAEAASEEIRTKLGIGSVEKLRILFRYDIESEGPLPLREAFSKMAVKAGPRVDLAGARVFAAEPAEGEEDVAAKPLAALLQAAFCKNVLVRSAKIYAVYGRVTEEELARIKAYLITPFEREARLSILSIPVEEGQSAEEFESIFGFRDADMGAMRSLSKKLGLDMGASELVFLQSYFRSEYRDPTAAELKVLGALISTSQIALSTQIDRVDFEGRGSMLERAYANFLSARAEYGERGAVTLSELASAPRRLAQRKGVLESGKEGSIPIKGKQDGRESRLYFYDETQPPVSSYTALLLGCDEDPISLTPLERGQKIGAATEQAEEFLLSDVAVGQVDAVFDSGYKKHPLGLGMFLSSTPSPLEGKLSAPVPGDKLLLVGKKGGGFSRLVQRGEFSELIKCYRKIGLGGIALAAAFLCVGSDVDLDAVPVEGKKDAAERALQSAKGSVLVAVGSRDAERFVRSAREAGFDASPIATVTEVPRLILRSGGKVAVNLSHDFLTKGGEGRHVCVSPEKPADFKRAVPTDFMAGMRALAGEKNVCSRKALAEMFDHSVGGNCVLAPYGGKLALTPSPAAVYRIPGTKSVSYMAWGGEPEIALHSPYHAAYLSIVESASKLIAAGADFSEIYLHLAGQFPLEEGETPWGKQFSAFLGAYKAQLDLGIASLGERTMLAAGKVPPALYSFAVTFGAEREIVSPAFKGAGHRVVLLAPTYDENGLPVSHSLIKNFKIVTALMRADKVLSAYPLGRGGVAEGVLKCCLGNEIGFRFADMVPMETVFGEMFGAFILELNDETAVGEELGRTTLSETIARGLDLVPLISLKEIYEGKLSPVLSPATIPFFARAENITSYKKSTYVAPLHGEGRRAVLPVFERCIGVQMAARAFEEAGAEAVRVPIDARTPERLNASLERLARELSSAQILYLTEGLEGYHVCGQAAYIATCLSRGNVKEEIEKLLSRGGLIGGVGVGFEALLRVGLLPYGEFRAGEDPAKCIFKHDLLRPASRTLQVRVSSSASPWMKGLIAGDICAVPARIFGGLALDGERVDRLAQNGQILAQFADLDGNALTDLKFDPCASSFAVEGLLSPDGRIVGSLTGFFLTRRFKERM